VALAFFAMTGFENAANVAEETIDPAKTFPKALVGGMICAGIIYVLVAMTAELVVGATVLADASAAGEPSLLEVVKADVLPVSVTLFAIIAMIAITNTTLVAVVTQSRILYGMAREDVVPSVFAKVHPTRRSPWVALILSAAVVCALLLVGELLNQLGLDIDLITTLANVTVLLLLVIYDLVIFSALKLRGDADGGSGSTFRAPTPLLFVGVAGNLVLAIYVVVDDWTSLLWCGGLIGVGLVLFAAEKAFGGPRPPGAAPSIAEPTKGA
jgi:amino acid transporter